MNPDPVGQARRLAVDRFPDAFAVILAGSTAAGRATANSDLDLAVLVPDGGETCRETIRFEGGVVELRVYDESDEPPLDEPIPEADRVWLLDQELGPGIRRVFRRVIDDRAGTAPMPAVTQVLYDTVFGPFRDDRDFLGFFYNEILHQDTCYPETADGAEVVAWLAVDDRVPAPHRMDLVEFLFTIATVGERQAVECWPSQHPNSDPVSERAARVAVEAAAGPVFARWDAECTAVRISLAQLAATFPAMVGPGALRHVGELADRLRGTTAADFLEFVAVMIEGDDAALLAAVERHTGWDADNDFRGSVRDLPTRVRALHLLDQMAFYERLRLRRCCHRTSHFRRQETNVY